MLISISLLSHIINNQAFIYTNKQTQIEVQFEMETFWISIKSTF